VARKGQRIQFNNCNENGFNVPQGITNLLAVFRVFHFFKDLGGIRSHDPELRRLRRKIPMYLCRWFVYPDEIVGSYVYRKAMA
jgi:hypothetical protein